MTSRATLVALTVALAIAYLASRSHGSRTSPVSQPTARPTTLARVAEAPALPNTAAVHPIASRAPGEWQGMPVDRELAPLCDVSARCGLATACIAGRCTGCTTDTDCASGEACVLDHCVLTERVSCRTRRDCGAAELCVLSGISPDARGNGDMRAYCSGPGVEGVQDRARHERRLDQREGLPAPPRPVTPQRLLDSL